MTKRENPSNKECIELINAFTGTVYQRLLIKEIDCPKADNNEDESTKNISKQHEIKLLKTVDKFIQNIGSYIVLLPKSRTRSGVPKN